MDKLNIDKLILVEGKYDKIRLENIVNSDIFVLNGFGIFKNKTAISTIKKLSRNKEILILTDSDTAGYKIRVYLSSVLEGYKITNVFIPQIVGKEKRKTLPSAEGFLGVEGVSDDQLREVLEKFTTDIQKREEISVSDLFKLGLTGGDGSKKRKNQLLKSLGVQQNISNRFLLRILNDRFTLDEFLNYFKEM